LLQICIVAGRAAIWSRGFHLDHRFVFGLPHREVKEAERIIR
jgi:hypothetical protein